MSDVTIYHNPRCSKSRQTLELIRAQGIEPNIIEYLKTPPSSKQIKQLLELLGMKPRELMRTKEAAYEEEGLDDESLSVNELIDAMHDQPKLIERPIVVRGDKAIIGRPPEKVLEII